MCSLLPHRAAILHIPSQGSFAPIELLCDDEEMGLNAGEIPSVAVVTPRAAARLRAGHLWVYRSDIERLSGDPPAGALLDVVDGRDGALGAALWSDGSEIALRLVSRQNGLDRAGYLAQLADRVHAAIALRMRVAPEVFSSAGEGNACRLVFSEADELPGLVADRYNGLVVVQLLTQGTAQDDVRRVLVEALSRYSWIDTVVERPDPRMRELEQLPAPSQAPLFVREGSGGALQTVFTINGLRFHFDAGAGQKTGAFLDQRLNYAAAAGYVTGHALDVCTYQGGFALHLAQACAQVTGVDASRAALEVADRNLELNMQGAHGLTAKVNWIEADAFELMRDYAANGQRFDTVVLDPPAFAKSKRATEGALRGYKELNLRAMQLLRHAPNGGTLVTCSCSHHIGIGDFMAVVSSAARDAGLRVQLLETRGAAPDHPAVLTLPETSYLKCLILRVG